MKTYKIIARDYYETMDQKTPNKGKFVARGEWEDGHLAYSRLDDDNKEIDGEECAYIQLRGYDGKLYMQRV